MEQKIEIKISDWLYNVGLLGLHNILKYKGAKLDITDDSFSFDVADLEGFEDSYFSYLIDRYKPTLSITKIISFEEIIRNWEENNYEKFNQYSLDKLNNQIEQVKKYVKSNSYKSAYELIDCPFNPLEKEKSLKKIKIKKSNTVENEIDNIKEQVLVLKEFISFFKQKDTQRFIGAKNIIYTVIRNAWDNVSILNRQNKNPDMYDEIANYFVKPAIDFKTTYVGDIKKYKYVCMACNSLMKNLDNDLSFINEIGFDVSRKTSHVWDHNNYAAICPVCKLVYSCIPAGFSYAYNRGIFVNYSSNLKHLIKINERIKCEMDIEANQNTSVYYAIQRSMDANYNEDMRYELSDIQIVRYIRDMDSGKNKYLFNILNRSIQNVIYTCNGELKYIKGAYLEEGSNNVVYLYNQVMSSLFNNENQFLLISKLLHYKLSNPNKSRYTCDQIQKIIKINVEYLEETGYMNKQKEDYIKYAKSSGYYLREEFKKMDAEKKLNGIAYRMLNALKTTNKHAFMDILINASMYANREVNSVFIDVLEDDLKFKNVGYAFIAAMIGKKEESEEANKETNIEGNKGE